MTMVPALCPQCGKKIVVDNTHDANICELCGSPIITEKAINKYQSILNNDSIATSAESTADNEFKVGSTVTFGHYVDIRPLTNQETLSTLFGNAGASNSTSSTSGITNDQVVLRPIEWLLLAEYDNRYLLLSKNCIDTIRYNSMNIFRRLKWESCELRSWLNKDFYDAAFSEEEKKKIVMVTNTNKDQPTTEDRVFLLSLEEAELLFNDDNERRCKGTILAQLRTSRNIINQAYDQEGNASWWLRAPCISESSTAPVVHKDGSLVGKIVGNLGMYNFISCIYKLGVRPALWLTK